MRILFDNGTPRPIARSLVGHDVRYARRIGWHELTNGVLIAKAEDAGSMFFSAPIRTSAISRT